MEIEQPVQVAAQVEQPIEEEEDILSKPYVKKYTEQDLLLDGILQLPIDKVISILQSSLPTVELPEIKESFMSLPAKDPLEFVYQLHPEEEQYL